MKPKMHMTFVLPGLKKLQRRSPIAFNKAMQVAGIQFLNWANNGSKNESRKPPIRYGVLRGSSSVFVGSKLVKVQPQSIKEHGIATPARNHNGRPDSLTVVWNTDYAKKMHEWKGGWGKFTKQDTDAGNKWLEKHLQKDRKDLVKLVALEVKKELHL